MKNILKRPIFDLLSLCRIDSLRNYSNGVLDLFGALGMKGI